MSQQPRSKQRKIVNSSSSYPDTWDWGGLGCFGIAGVTGAILGGVIGYFVGGTMWAIWGALIGAVAGMIAILIPSEIWEGIAAIAQIIECCAIFGAFLLAISATLTTILVTHNVWLSLSTGGCVFVGWCSLFALLAWWQMRSAPQSAYARKS